MTESVSIGIERVGQRVKMIYDYKYVIQNQVESLAFLFCIDRTGPSIFIS